MQCVEFVIKWNDVNLIHGPVNTCFPVHQCILSSSSCSPGQTACCGSSCGFSSESSLQTDHGKKKEQALSYRREIIYMIQPSGCSL